MAPQKKETEPRFPDRKISEVFLQFAEPLLEALDPGATEAEMEQPLQIAWTVWNAVVYADAANDTRGLAELRRLMGQTPELEAFAENLITRKRSVFGEDHRLIGQYTLYRKDGEIRIRAEARIPSSA